MGKNFKIAEKIFWKKFQNEGSENLKREELNKLINESPERFFEKDKSGKGYVCVLCGSGTGKHGTGLTAKRMSDGRIILTCWKCGESGDVIHWLEKTKGMSYKEVLEYGAKDIMLHEI